MPVNDRWKDLHIPCQTLITAARAPFEKPSSQDQKFPCPPGAHQGLIPCQYFLHTVKNTRFITNLGNFYPRALIRLQLKI